MRGSRGGRGARGTDPRPPWKITSYMGFYRESAIGHPHPLENVGLPLKHWENIAFFVK